MQRCFLTGERSIVCEGDEDSSQEKVYRTVERACRSSYVAMRGTTKKKDPHCMIFVPNTHRSPTESRNLRIWYISSRYLHYHSILQQQNFPFHEVLRSQPFILASSKRLLFFPSSSHPQRNTDTMRPILLQGHVRKTAPASLLIY